MLTKRFRNDHEFNKFKTICEYPRVIFIFLKMPIIHDMEYTDINIEFLECVCSLGSETKNTLVKQTKAFMLRFL